MRKDYETTPGAPCWLELWAGNPDQVKGFYEGLFGWSFRRDRSGHTTVWSEAGPVAGLRAVTPERPVRGWVVHLATRSLRSDLAEVGRRGGTTVWVGDRGLAVVCDRGGTVTGLAELGRSPSFERVAEPGAPCWFELRTAEFTVACAFLSEVLLWPLHPRGIPSSGRSASHGRGHSQRASVTELAEAELPTGLGRWWVHFGTADCRDALGRVGDLGGTALGPSYDAGGSRMAAVADPDGAVFRLVESPIWPTAAMPIGS